MNPLMALIGGAGPQNGRAAIFLKAMAACARGETPEQFLSSLAKTDPRFRGLDFTDLEQTVKTLCRQKGVDEAQLVEEVKSEVSSITP